MAVRKPKSGVKPLKNVKAKGIEAPDCPYPLRGHALEEWDRTAGAMLANHVITRTTLEAWACYCRAFGMHSDAMDELAGGITLTTDSGGTKSNPAASIAMKSLDQMMKYLAMFGLTPNLKLPVDQTAGDPFDVFIKKKQ